MDRGAQRPPESSQPRQVVAFSLFHAQPIIFADPDGQMPAEEQEELSAGMPPPPRTSMMAGL